MNLESFLAAADRAQAEGLALIAAASALPQLESARTATLGRKSGQITALFAQLAQLDPDARRAAGAAANRVKSAIEDALSAREAELRAAAPRSGVPSDLTMPARAQWRGALHPVTRVIEEITGIFRELGFTVALGPEAETEWYNFGALNFPADHPAMDLHDTLYIGETGDVRRRTAARGEPEGDPSRGLAADSRLPSPGSEGDLLLRTHTSPVQIRVMQNYKPPIRILAPGNVYRHDPFDASHAPMFAQIEGLAVDEGVSFVDLKATLTRFAQKFFGAETRTRFRPSYFPFTEPSAEMDVECGVCKGAGCATCKHTGWTEIMGAGMVHPNVFVAAGLDAERYTGWAFGMGPARIAMARYAIPDIRLLYESDMRFLEQFA